MPCLEQIVSNPVNATSQTDSWSPEFSLRLSFFLGILGSIRQMSRQASRGSAGEYQADEQAGVARLSW